MSVWASAKPKGKQQACWLSQQRHGGLPYVPHAPILLDGFDTLTGATFATNSTSNVLDATSQIQGAGRLLSSGNGVNATLTCKRTVTGPYAPSDLGVVVACIGKGLTNIAAVNGQNLSLGRGATTASISFSDTQKFRAGHRWVAANISEFGASVLALTSGTWDVKPGVTQAAPYNADVFFDAVYANAKGRSTIVLTFDDGYDTIYSTVFPILEAHGFKGNFYVSVTSGVNQANRVTLAQMQELYRHGWDFGCDSTPNDAATSTDPPTALASITTNRDWLIANGFTRAHDHLCWTNGSWTEAVAANFQANGFLSARTTEPQSFYDRFGNLGNFAMTIPSRGFNNTAALSSATTRVDEALLRGSTQFFHFHDIKDVPSAIGWQTANFAALMGYIRRYRNAGQLDVLTLSQWWARVSAGVMP